MLVVIFVYHFVLFRCLFNSFNHVIGAAHCACAYMAHMHCALSLAACVFQGVLRADALISSLECEQCEWLSQLIQLQSIFFQFFSLLNIALTNFFSLRNTKPLTQWGRKMPIYHRIYAYSFYIIQIISTFVTLDLGRCINAMAQKPFQTRSNNVRLPAPDKMAREKKINWAVCTERRLRWVAAQLIFFCTILFTRSIKPTQLRLN